MPFQQHYVSYHGQPVTLNYHIKNCTVHQSIDNVVVISNSDHVAKSTSPAFTPESDIAHIKAIIVNGESGFALLSSCTSHGAVIIFC